MAVVTSPVDNGGCAHLKTISITISIPIKKSKNIKNNSNSYVTGRQWRLCTPVNNDDNGNTDDIDNDIDTDIGKTISPITSPVNDGGRARLPLEEIVDLLPVQTRLVKVRQLPCNLGVRELLELLAELHERELVLQ